MAKSRIEEIIIQSKYLSKEMSILVYLPCGYYEGGFYEGCSILNKILTEKGIESQNHIFKGHHSIEYIKSNIEKYMKFYGN